MGLRLFIILLLIFTAGCSGITKDIRRQADRSITIPMVHTPPDAFKGSKVIWGGIILSSKILADKTVIEALQTPLDRTDRVINEEQSKGRFLIESKTYLDTYLYKPGKEITAAGIIRGITVQKIGEMDYAYPVLEPLHIRVFEPQREPEYEPPPPMWPYYPYYPYLPR